MQFQLHPNRGERVIRIGEILLINWNSMDISNINIIFYKGSERILVSKKMVSNGQNVFSIFIDSSYYTDNYVDCKIRLEMEENPNVYSESYTFKILKSDDRGA